MNYFIEIQTVNKAKSDIDEIVKGMGFRSLTPVRKKKDMISRFVTKAGGVFRILTWLKRDDVLFLQYPMKKFYKIACRFAHWKGAKVVTVIHDLGAFRRHKLTPEQENRRLSQTDFIIVHNEKMKEHLLSKGCRSRLTCLGIFDYLSQTVPQVYPVPHHPWTVVYAGGLGKWRNGFLYQVDAYIRDWTLVIYGKGFEKEYATDWKHIIYHGFLDSEHFVAQVEADFGLVWDGDSVDGCSGDWGEYLRVNNPHKTSFYLRSGLPVIVWSQSAMAPFIQEHKVGICVESLADIDKALNELTTEHYQIMKENALKMGQLLGEGYFIKRALDESFRFFAENKK